MRSSLGIASNASVMSDIELDSMFMVQGGEAIEASPETIDRMMSSGEMNFIGKGSPRDMKKTLSLKDVMAFNERQLKIIEQNNINSMRGDLSLNDL